MRRAWIGWGLVLTLALPPAATTASVLPAQREAEGCQAFNPGQPECSYTVTHSTDSPVTGVSGAGDWVVKIVRGKKKKRRTTETITSPASGEPTAIEYQFKPGDKVTATALSPGSGLIVGHAD
jgi:hypothetical protein